MQLRCHEYIKKLALKGFDGALFQLWDYYPMKFVSHNVATWCLAGKKCDICFIMYGIDCIVPLIHIVMEHKACVIFFQEYGIQGCECSGTGFNGQRILPFGEKHP